jgi:plasmid stabilization system protein ParE
MKPLVYHPEALEEAIHEQEYYEACEEGLGLEFRDMLDVGFDVIERRPKSIRRRDGAYQKFFMDRFPFAIVFREFDDFIQIVAIKHHKRDPDYWKHRISSES